MTNEEYFQQLSIKRERFSSASEENNFDLKGWLTKLYPNKAHFVYELLQNAEDANAHRVDFQLMQDALYFVHDGERIFERENVESITSIGNSTKSEEVGKIGKFGIGFKSVFSYTDTPIIHSGCWHFRIRDLVVPELTDEDRDLWEKDRKKTVFSFPFNCQDKLPQKAYAEILHELQCMDSETILFLHNIQEVYISYEDKERVITRSLDRDGHLISLRSIDEKNDSRELNYLKFENVVRDFKVEEDSRMVSELPVAIAFKLECRESCETQAMKLSDRFEIVPVTTQNVFVYFPAEKESSGLRFCIQAPFATTAARDSVQDLGDNHRIVDLLVELLKNSLEFLKDEGFLTTDFLGVLPNSKDEKIGKMYQGFHDSLVESFREKPYTPTRDGNHSPARVICSGDSELVKILSDDDLRKLRGEGTKWVKNAAQRNQNADKFLSDLKIHKYELSELIDKLAGSKDLTRTILSEKDVAQLRVLYVELNKYVLELDSSYFEREKGRQIIEALKKLPIIMVEDGSLSCPNEGVYIASQYADQMIDRTMRFVHQDLLNGDIAEDLQNKLKHFFAKLGVVEYNEAEAVRLFIEEFWRNQPTLSDNDWVRNISRLLNLVARKTIDEKTARRFPVLNGDNHYVEISRTYIDSPYEDTGMSCLGPMLASAGHHMLNDCYSRLLNENDLKIFRENLSCLGVRSQLWVCDAPVRNNPRFYEELYTGRNCTAYGSQYDYDIPGLREYVGQLNQIQGQRIWNLLLRQHNTLKAFYSASRADPGNYSNSTYVCLLKGSAWIVCKDGKSRKPSEVDFEMLPDDWPRPKSGYEDESLRAIEFGRETKLRQAEQEKKEQVLKESGFKDSEEVDELREIKKACQERGLTPRQALSQLAGDKRQSTHTPKELPKRSASNVNQRMSIASTNFQKASKQTYVVVGRSVHVGNSHIRDAARTYLRGEYESNGEMFCQLCHSSMPFKGRDGYGYFEATQVFARMKKDITEQFISLCPTCRAKYDEWVRRSQDRSRAFKDAILKHKPQQGEESVAIPLPGESENGVKSPLSGKSVYFTGTHFVDLRQAVLENEKLGGLDDFTELEPAATGMSQNQSFVDWYLKYDPEGEAALKQITNAFANLEKCRQQGKKLGVVMWTTCSEGYLKKVMTFWADYHSLCPQGESEADAGVSVERYCRSKLNGQ